MATIVIVALYQTVIVDVRVVFASRYAGQCLRHSGYRRSLKRDSHFLGCHFPFLNAVENVQVALEISDTPPRAARQRALELLDYLGVADR
jgi:ABC-type methionine transport system ATPase subunit